mgnify:CR=1 FL=1
MTDTTPGGRMGEGLLDLLRHPTGCLLVLAVIVAAVLILSWIV